MTERLFVYGTLKRGHANARSMPLHLHVANATTEDPYPLVASGRWFSPVLIDEPGTGHRVLGELVEIDDGELAALDAFEGVGLPGGYRRAPIRVVVNGAAEKAWAYVKDRCEAQPIHGDPITEYLPDARYVPGDRR